MNPFARVYILCVPPDGGKMQFWPRFLWLTPVAFWIATGIAAATQESGWTVTLVEVAP